MMTMEINKKATRKAANQLLINFRSLKRIAGSLKQHERSNHHLLKTEIQIKAKKQVNLVLQALEELSEEDYQILYKKYICCHFTTNIAIYMDLNMSESKFYRGLEKALIHFSEAYDGGSLLIENGKNSEGFE